MKHLTHILIAISLLSACSPKLRIAGKKALNPLERALAAHADDFDSILLHPGLYEVQIIYTQIDRDARQQPHFSTYRWNVDDARYFYPASMVKMPLALLALEKINQLKRSGYPKVDRNSFYSIDSLRPFQQNYRIDSSAPQNRPSIAHDIRKIFTVSDNLAYNHMFEFLGREYINKTLAEKGYVHTGIVHRFNYPGRDNRYASPMSFYTPTFGIFKQGEILDNQSYKNPQTGILKGNAYLDETDSLIQRPFDFSRKNWFALSDMDNMLRAVIFPKAVPEAARFDLSADDYRFVRHYMGIFPRECDYPKYDSTHYPDNYAKFLLFGDDKQPHDGTIREFSKIGEAYGTLTEAAYVVDFENNVEFMLSATILCNRDGVFNDDRYDYETVGLPFLAKLGRAVYEYELKRERKVVPDLSGIKEALR